MSGTIAALRGKYYAATWRTSITFSIFFIFFLLAIYKRKGYHLSTAPTRAHNKERATP
jgi:hypothetical protein